MSSIKKILIRTSQGLLIASLIFIGLSVVSYFSNIIMPWNRGNAIETALEWGGLADLPEDADIISVETEGSAFTREFIDKFHCDPDEINKWIKLSNLHNLTPLGTLNGVISYRVEGQEGSIGGYVYIDNIESNVIIDMMWS